MTDVHSKSVRSYNMSQIKSKDTKPEILVRKFLFKNGDRYRVNVKSLPGKPDIVLPKYRTVIFVNGCFWHGHENCRYFVQSKTRKEWWINKINRNIENDQKKKELLEKEGWYILTIWECQLKKDKKEDTLDNIIKELKKVT